MTVKIQDSGEGEKKKKVCLLSSGSINYIRLETEDKNHVALQLGYLTYRSRYECGTSTPTEMLTNHLLAVVDGLNLLRT